MKNHSKMLAILRKVNVEIVRRKLMPLASVVTAGDATRVRRCRVQCDVLVILKFVTIVGHFFG